MPTLHLGTLGVPRRARLQLVRRLLVRGIQGPAHLPAQAAALPGLVLGVLARHLVELGAVAESGQGLFFPRVLLALDCRVSVCCCFFLFGRAIMGRRLPGCDGC